MSKGIDVDRVREAQRAADNEDFEVMRKVEARDALMEVLWGKKFPYGGRAGEFVHLDANAAHGVANTVMDAGYHKHTVLGYVLVNQHGHLRNDTQYRALDEAQDQARWLNSCRLDHDTPEYRVAEIVEPSE